MATDCADDLETLHQFTGQCWSDASLIYLWFAGPFGPSVQQELEKESFLNDLKTFFTQDPVYFNLRYYFPSIQDFDKYTEFCEILFDYAREMKERYMNWKHPTKGPALRRSTSCTLSTKIEHNGILLGEILAQKQNPKISKKNIETLYKKIESINTSRLSPNSTAEAEEQIRKELAKEGLGYSTSDFGNVIYVLLKFFLRNQKMYVLHQTEFNKINEQENKQKVDFLRYLTNEIVSYNLNSPFLDLNAFHFLSPNIVDSFLYSNFNESVSMSFLASCALMESGKVNYPKKFHAISFLTCSNNETILYDDNLAKMNAVSWRSIFNKMSQHVQTKYTANTSVHLESFLLYPLSKNLLEEKLKFIIELRNDFNNMRQELLTSTNKNSAEYKKLYQIFKKVLDIQKKTRGRDFFYTDIFIETPSISLDEIQSLEDEYRNRYLQRYENEMEEIEMRLKYSEALQQFVAPEGFMAGSILEKIADFQPFFCLVDHTNNEFILYNKTGEELLVRKNEFDNFTFFFNEIYMNENINFLMCWCETVYKIQTISTVACFQHSVSGESRNEPFSKAYHHLTNTSILGMGDVNSNYAGGRRKQTRKQKRRFCKTRKH